MLPQAMVKREILVEAQNATEIKPQHGMGVMHIMLMLYKMGILISLFHHIFFQVQMNMNN